MYVLHTGVVVSQFSSVAVRVALALALALAVSRRRTIKDMNR